MKKFICMVLTLSMVMSTVNIALPIKSYAENEGSVIELYSTDNIIDVTSVDEMQSEHPYLSNTDITYVYTHQGDADSLNITFSDDTEVESNYDFIYIYDGNGVEIDKYTGTELAGQTVEVSGNIVKIRLTSDSSVTRNGFTVTNIDAVLSTGPITNLKYTSRTKDSVTLSFPTPKEATSVTVEQSVDGKEWITSTTTEALDASSTIATVTGLEMETQYYFRLNVVGGTREGLSNEISVTTYGLYTPEESFEFSDGVITEYVGEDTEVVIPSKINDVTVTSIGEDAFYQCADLASIVIPNSVTSIGDYAFYGCTSLIEVKIPTNLMSIGNYAFCNCSSLIDITIPETVIDVRSGAFSDCARLEKVYWNATNVEGFGFGDVLFNNAGVEGTGITVIFGENVKEIPSHVFENCTGLTSVEMPDSVTTIGEYAFYYCENLSNVIMGDSVVSVGDCSFSNCKKLLNISIPDSVLDIGCYAFSYCENLINIKLGNNVSNIGYNAFDNCINISTIEIPASVISIGSNAFECCYSLTNIMVHNENMVYSSHDGNLFDKNRYKLIQYAIGKSDTTYTVPAGVTCIGNNAFSKCLTLENVILNDSITNIESSAFYECENLYGIDFGESVTYIDSWAFAYCKSLASVFLPDSVVNISYNAFYECENITDIHLGNYIESIGDCAFWGCSKLINIVIPSSVNSIGKRAFYDCSSLTSIAVEEENNNYSSLEGNLFNKDKSILIQYSIGRTDDSYIIPDGVTNISDYAFYGCTSLAKVTMPTALTQIGYSSFSSCDSLVSVTIPNGVTNISDSAFLSCTNLISVTIPKSVTSINSHAFTDCIALTDVYYYGSIEDWNKISIGSYNTYLTSATIHYSEEIETYTIAYDANGGSGAPEPHTKNEGESISLSSVIPTREGYTFLGWATTSDAIEAEYDSDATFEIDADTTLYAVWQINKLNTYTITYDANGGNGAPEPQTKNEGESITLSSAVPTREGYTFLGWATTSNATEIEYTSGATFELNSDTTLYAVWKVDEDYGIIRTSNINDLRSEHPYSNNEDTTWIYTHPSEADSLEITFSDDTEVESNYDYIYIYDGNDVEIDKYTGTELAGQTVEVSGNIVKIRLTSDSSVTRNGFTVTNIDAVLSTGPITNLKYTSRTKDSVTLSFPTPKEATSVTVEQSVDGKEWIASTTTEALGASSTIATVIGLEKETQYYFRLNVVGGTREGLSNEIIVTTRGLYTDEGSFISDKGVITGYIGGDTDVFIPNEIDGYSVISIDEYAFYGCDNLTSITISDSVTSIGSYAFFDCPGLTTITIPDSVNSIGENAFAWCENLRSVHLPNSVTSIGDGTFSGCTSLTSVTIPDSVTSIEANAFFDCFSLTNITIPSSVTFVGNYAFYNCQSLANITIPDGITSIEESMFGWCINLTSVTIPDSVTSISDFAFYNCSSLTDIYYGGSSQDWNNLAIGEDNHYFLDATLHFVNEVIDNSSIKYLDYFINSEGGITISRCDTAASGELIIPNEIDGYNVTSVENGAFLDCTNLISVTIPNSVTSIGYSTFIGCTSLTSVIIGDGVTSIEKYTFKDCTNLTSVTIGGSVTSIGDGAFSGCTSLTSVTIPDSVIEIGNWAFDGCTSLTSVTIGDNVISIGESAFDGCTSLINVTIPNSVTSIGRLAFYKCTGLTIVTVGTGITSIGTSAFSQCDNLKEVHLTDIEAWCNINFYDKSATLLRSTNSIYLNGKLLKNLIIPDGVKTINSHTFFNCTSLTSVTIPDSVTSIGDGAFKNCTSLTSVTIGDSVTSIGKRAFQDCTNLTSVTIPDSVTSIGDYAFSGCSNLTDVYYSGNEENWMKIDIGYANYALTSSTIHYSTYVLDVEPLPQEGEIKKSIGVFKTYYEDDNRVWIDELGDFSLVSTRYVTDKTDTKFLDDLESIINEYVLVEENVYWEHGTYYGNILSLQPVDTIIGRLSLVANNTIVVDSKSYNIDKEFSQIAKLSLNKYVMIHILDDEIVGITQLHNKKGILTEYKESEGILVIDGSEYSISRAADMSSLSNINNMIGEKIGFYLDDAWGWNIVRISSHETITGELWFYSKTQNEVSVGDKTYCINTDEYTFNEDLLGKRVFCLVEDDFIIHMDSIYKLMPRLLISISSPELSYNNGFENSSFSVNAELRNRWNYDLPQMYNEDVILKDEFFRALSTTNITLGDMTWDANENVEYILSGSNCGGMVIPFKGSHQMTLEGKIKDGYVPPEYKTNLTSEFCIQAQEPKTSRTLTATHNLRITNLGKKPLAAENFVSNNTPLQNVYLYANQLNENLNDYLEEIKNTPDKVMSSEEQLETIAQRLMEEDDNSSSKRINGLDGIIGMPEEDRIYAYMAFAQYLQGYVNEGIDLGKIDVSANIIEVATNIVNAVRSNMDWTQFTCEYGGYTIDMSIGSYSNVKNGTITLQKNGGKKYTGYIISTNAEIASAMESYLKQVKELGINATNEILYSYAGELAKLTGFADIEKSAIKKVVDRKLNKVFKNSGFGDVTSILKNCYDCFDQIRDILKCTTPDDLVGTLSDTEDYIKKLEKLDFEKYDISEGVTSKIVDKINDSRKALVAALNDYLIDEGTDSSGNFFDSFRKHIIECPVDFTVYDESNNEIGYVRNGLIYCDDSMHIETKGEVKYVYIPKDKDYKIELEATDDGEFTYVVEDVNNGNVSGRLNFYSIPITAGNTFIPEIQTKALTGNKNEVYLNSDNGIIKADEYISGDSEKILVEIGYVGNGTVVGGGTYTKGDSVTLSATANKGYSFKGWYNEDGIVSNKNIYRFPAISDVEIYAEFERANIVDSRFTIDIDEDYTDKMYVKAYKNDGITNNISVNLFDFSNISAELDLKCVLYNKDKVIEEIIREAKFDESCGGYVIVSIDLNQCDIMEIYDSSDNLLATLMNNDTCEIRALDSLENSLIVNADYVGVDLDVYNQSASQQTLRAHLGIYDNDNSLIDLLSSDPIIVEPNTSNNLNIDKEIDIKNAESTYHIKLFIWENGNSLKPLSKTQEVIVNE